MKSDQVGHLGSLINILEVSDSPSGASPPKDSTLENLLISTSVSSLSFHIYLFSDFRSATLSEFNGGGGNSSFFVPHLFRIQI